MASTTHTMKEEDIIRMTLEFLQNRGLHIAQLSLERESGVINGSFSEDVLFMRQLILDGQWDDVLDFIQPLETLPEFNAKQFRFIILQHKYIELLCVKTEACGVMNASTADIDTAVQEVVSVLEQLEKVSPTKEAYSNLCLLLTLPRLSDNSQYKDWNPSNARVQCFREVYPLVQKFLSNPGKNEEDIIRTSKGDRLIQLIIKGILYESCVRFCTGKVAGWPEPMKIDLGSTRVLNGSSEISEADLGLISWLQVLPDQSFTLPFMKQTLDIEMEGLVHPSLETSWTEHMLVTPIKPKTFPHSAMPFTRPKTAADVMSRSLLPALDGMEQSVDSESLKNKVAAMNISSGSVGRSAGNSFHLNAPDQNSKSSKLMNTSMDRLFENESDVFLSGTYCNDPLPSISEVHQQSSTKFSGTIRRNNGSGEGGSVTSSSSMSDFKGSTDSSRRDSLNDRLLPPSGAPPPPPAKQFNSKTIAQPATQRLEQPQMNNNFDREHLFKEYQRQKGGSMDQSHGFVASVVSNQIINDLSGHANQQHEANSAAGRNGFGGNAAPSNLSHKPDVVTTTVHQAQIHNNRPESSGHSASSHGHSSHVHVNGGGASSSSNGSSTASSKAKFVPITTLEDVQAVRCAEFHPNGRLYAVGSNSKTLRICSYPNVQELLSKNECSKQPCQPNVLFKRTRHHKGSIYCMAWTPDGDILATGSNDKTVKLLKFNAAVENFEGPEIELGMHDGTVRDVCFLEDTSNKSSLLISGGAGDCKIYVTDCATGQPFQALSGHSGHVLSLYNWGGAIFASGSQDRTVRFWDLRTRGCVNVITPVTASSKQGSAVASVCVEPSGRLLVSGHEDASCVLYDIRGCRQLQSFKPHASDVRSIRFSPSAYYLLTGGYDSKLVLTDLQSDLTAPLASVVVGSHQDKVISARWHPAEFSFLSTSADKTSTLWVLPPP